jgi:phospholipase C
MRSVRQFLLIAGLVLASQTLVLAQFGPPDHSPQSPTTTPIKHLVVIFQENNSFDHYFGSYPHAANPAGEPPFYPLPGTPAVNGLTPGLQTHNPNSAQPFRLDRSQASTCDNDNHYHDEQAAYDGGLLDNFSILGCSPGLQMGYYDGNTVTALWNFAQHFAMSDNFFASTFGTTVMGHLNLLSGQTHGATPASISGKVANGSVIANVDPVLDDCSTGSVVTMSGKNIGDLLNAANNGKGVTWGWFYADWTESSTGNAQGCSTFNPHYAPFQYYASTANPHHRPPTSVAMIGQTDQANHQYNLTDLWSALDQGILPAVTFIKADSTQTGHAADGTPLSEQQFLVETISRLEQSPFWKDMAILITYDDSDGWYDHVMPPIMSRSNDPANDALLGPTRLCGTPAAGAYNDRCGYGPRLPFLAISPFAKRNFVDNTLTDQSSITRFIEDNWQTGQIGDQSFDAVAGPILNMFDFRGGPNHALFLDPNTGEPTHPLDNDPD